jgi:deaminated glutathione amidase
VRFPELYRQLAVHGATLLFVPAAFRFETGVDHWDVLIRARAIEDQAFVIAAAQWGAGDHRGANDGTSATASWSTRGAASWVAHPTASA